MKRGRTDRNERGRERALVLGVFRHLVLGVSEAWKEPPPFIMTWLFKSLKNKILPFSNLDSVWCLLLNMPRAPGECRSPATGQEIRQGTQPRQVQQCWRTPFGKSNPLQELFLQGWYVKTLF